MSENRKSYRIRTVVGKDAPVSVNVNLTQTYDVVDVLSLQIDEKNFYQMPAAGYGVIVGRVIANGGFGIPNAKVSVFIPYELNLVDTEKNSLYMYSSPASKDSDGVRYNLLPRHLDDACHQDVGTMYEKEYMLDNNNLIEVFDKYYKYTAVTNTSGDYFIYGVPVGAQTLHVDIDLSDIGVLSQRPRDMIYKGYNINQFENPNKFKKDTNLNSLAQIYTQDRVVTVYPFWGDTTVDTTNGTITRCDIDIDYKFEPTCIFLGSIISDTGSRAISQRCVPDAEMGKMANLVTGEGKIEMIRKTFDGKVEQFSIKGNNLIDSDGVWCYQIPMNLDYVVTDEFGNMVPTDDPNKGIATRTRVRFRISMNETETDDSARKRARFLVPNNPKLNDDYPDFNNTHEADYEFGTFTKEENYRDLFWNKVYTVKSYIPRLQKAKSLRRKTFTGIKTVNHAGNNNPFPYNNLSVELTFTYRFLCMLMITFCRLVYFINTILGRTVGKALWWVAWALLKIGDMELCGCGGCAPTLQSYAQDILDIIEDMLIKLDNICDDGNFDNPEYIPVGGWIKDKIKNGRQSIETTCGKDTWFPKGDAKISVDLGRLFNCIENQLAQDQECTSFNFQNDWINGVLYAPMWYRKVKPKKKIFFGLFERKLKDKWCNGDRVNTSTTLPTQYLNNQLALCQTCAQKRQVINGNLKFQPIIKNLPNITRSSVTNKNDHNCYGYKCHKKAVGFISLKNGLIIQKETKLNEYVYYYKAVEYDDEYLYSQTIPNRRGDIKTLFATDIVLLGSLNECNDESVPQFFKRLESSTFNLPSDLVMMDYYSDQTKINFEPRPRIKEEVINAMYDMNMGYSPLSNIEEDISESSSVNMNYVYTDTTGADWGNYGRDQVSASLHTDSTSIVYSTNKKEAPDYGGLFYGLTCWSAYTKPKSCVNLSRICEYGVSLDQAKTYPIYADKDKDDLTYATLPPDGYISYDEIYDMDGRAMFATMNGNNLRTKINEKNGFPIYDFMYLYPENFDGVVRNLIQAPTSVISQVISKNYLTEDSSEAYIRFRYGRNRDDSKVIQFYNSSQKIGLYDGDANKNRFPKYENSFYFYFGLNEGSTAIDKFRTQFYSDCQSDADVQSVVHIEYEGNDWCSEVTCSETEPFQAGSGWLKIDATYVEAPYKLLIKNLTGDSTYGYNSDNPLEFEKIYISVKEISAQDLNDGYIWLTKEINGYEQHFGLLNGIYRIQITDANGGVYIQDINFASPYLKADINGVPFRYKNEEIPEIIGCTPSDDKLNVIATYGGRSGENMSTRNNIGGFIKVTNVAQEEEKEINFAIDIKPLFNIVTKSKIISGTEAQAQAYQTTRGLIGGVTSYGGSHVEIHDILPIIDIVKGDDETLINPHNLDEPPYCPYTYDCPQYPIGGVGGGDDYVQINGGNYDIRMGVPKGGERYRVTVTMLCKIDDNYYPTRNQISVSVIVQEPIPFKMYINDVDYELIKNFKTGWKFNSYDSDEEKYYYLPDTTDPEIKGWKCSDLSNIDGITPLDLLTEDSPNKHYTYIERTEQILSCNPNITQNSLYNWTDEYIFNPEEVITGILLFDEIPLIKQSEVKFICVLDEDTHEYFYWLWDEGESKYNQYYRSNEPNVNVTTISLEEYYDLGLDEDDLDAKNYIIEVLNTYVNQRQSLVENMKTAFYIEGEYDSTSLSITNATLEKPVKTLMLYAPDEENSTTTWCEKLDATMEENTCYDITVGTLNGKLFDEHGNFLYDEPDEQEPEHMGREYFSNVPNGAAGEFKPPYWVAIQNTLSETIPSLSNDITNVANVAGELFGIHIIQKNLTFAYNFWNNVDYPFYYSGNDSDIPSNYLNKTIHLPGLFAGFILNGIPESYGEIVGGGYLETHFQEQKIGSKGKQLPIVTLSVDDNGQVDEARNPVVRFIYNNDINGDTIYYANYRVSNRLENIAPIGKQHFIINVMSPILFITSQDVTYQLFLSQDISTPEITYEYFNYNSSQYTVNVEFASGYYYTYFLNAENPVYAKVVNLNTDNTYLTFPNPVENHTGYTPPGENVLSMAFQCDDFDFSSIDNNVFNRTLDFNRLNTLFVVCISKDKQKRTISKTYDLTPFEYRLGKDTGAVSGKRYYIDINIGRQINIKYLKHYSCTLRFYDYGDNEIYSCICGPFIDFPNDIHQEFPTNYWRIYLPNFEGSKIYHFSKNVLLTDISGVTRRMYKVSNFLHTFSNI